MPAMLSVNPPIQAPGTPEGGWGIGMRSNPLPLERHRSASLRRMDTFIQQIINGLVLGSMYALVALGYTMVYGIINLINFAHGEVLMVGALTSWTSIGYMREGMPDAPGWLILLLATLIACVVAAVLNNPELRALWEKELGEMRLRIKQMRLALVEKLKAAGVKQDMGFITDQIGMFSYSGLSKDQMVRLRNEFSVYGTDTGRMCVAALNSKNIDYVCQSIAKVV